MEKNTVTWDKESSEWVNFLKDILEAKRILSSHFRPTPTIVRKQLKMDEDEEFSQEDEELVEMQTIEQELLRYACADFTLSLL